jgi:DNA-binding response OmpR family regulator
VFSVFTVFKLIKEEAFQISMEKIVLVAEDDEIIYDSIEMSLAKENIRTVHVSNGALALDSLKEQAFPVILTDLRMPQMSGNELVDKLLCLPSPPVIIIQSVVDDIQTIIGLMRRGVYDYLIKPYSFQELVIRVKKAFEIVELRAIKKHSESYRFFSKDLVQTSPTLLIENLDKSLFQILNQSEASQENIIIDKEVFLSLKEKYESTMTVFHQIERLGLHCHVPGPEEAQSLKDLNKLVQEVIKGFQEYQKIKNHNIVFNGREDCMETRKLYYDPISMVCLIREILFNAMKFGKADSNIYFSLSIQGADVFLVIENLVDTEDPLPKSLNLLFEPFFQLSHNSLNLFPTANVGLGLTIARRIVLNHSGSISCSTNQSQPESISFLVTLPLVM